MLLRKCTYYLLYFSLVQVITCRCAGEFGRKAGHKAMNLHRTPAIPPEIYGILELAIHLLYILTNYT
jgi:hypothetical protein